MSTTFLTPTTVIQNLTPHTINLYNEAGELLGSFEPAAGAKRGKETAARVAATPRKTGDLSCYGDKIGDFIKVPLFEVSYGAVENLPAESPGYIYIVSGATRAAVPNRLDVVSPGELMRDAAGNVVGCIGFYVNHPLAHLFLP